MLPPLSEHGHDGIPPMLKMLGAIALLLCTCGANAIAGPSSTLPSPPPPKVGAPVTDALRALGGEWRLA